MRSAVTTWEVTISGLWIDGALSETCELVVAWKAIGDYYDDPRAPGKSVAKIEVVDIAKAYGLESGNDYTYQARSTSGLKEYLEEIVTERLEI